MYLNDVSITRVLAIAATLVGTSAFYTTVVETFSSGTIEFPVMLMTMRGVTSAVFASVPENPVMLAVATQEVVMLFAVSADVLVLVPDVLKASSLRRHG